MSLLAEAMGACTMLDKTTADDGYGGYTVTYRDGASIQAAVVFNSSLEARVADVQGVTSLYTIVTSRVIVLEYHDVLRREEDGKIFRVTSDGDDQYTPQSATLDMRVVTAEEWSLPNVT